MAKKGLFGKSSSAQEVEISATNSSSTTEAEFPSKEGAGSLHSNQDNNGSIRVDTNVKVVESVELTRATVEQQPSPWSRSMFRLYLCLAVPVLISLSNGYDTMVMADINGQPQYRRYFGFDPEKGTPSTGIVFGIYAIGQLIGSFIGGPASDFRGRKWGMFAGAVILFIFTFVQATCQSLAQFMAARFMIGFGMAIAVSAAPTYVSEMAHPSYRGPITSGYNVFWLLGALPSSFIGYGTEGMTSTLSWRLPLYLQAVFPLGVIFGAPFLPESPRWLMGNDRQDEAFNVLVKYHGDGDERSPIVLLEYREMLGDIPLNGADKRFWGYGVFFRTREMRYRSMLVVAMSLIGQWAGNGAVSYYYSQMLATAGITNRKVQLFLNGIQQVVALSGAIIGACFTDKWGRRPLLLSVSIAVLIIFTIITPLNATNLTTSTNSSGEITVTARDPLQARAIIGLIFLFGLTFSLGFTPLQVLYPTECLRYEARAKGLGMANFIVNIAQFINMFATQIGFSRIGWKWYFVYIAWNTCAIAFIWRFFPETRNRTLEELTDIFRSESPVKASLVRSQVVIRGEMVFRPEELHWLENG